MPINRRTFLLSGAGAAILLGCRSSEGSGDPAAAPTSLLATRTAPTTPSAPVAPTAPSTTGTVPTSTGGGTLVVVTLHGGNDALNTGVPVGDLRYAAARRALTVDPAAAHDLGAGFALHPVLVGTKELWDTQRLAIVHGVGFPGLDRSHFHCMDVWQAGQEDDLATGWLGRWLDAVSDDPLDAVAVGRTLPLAMRGARRSAAVVPAGPFALPGGDQMRLVLTGLVAPDDARAPLAAMVASSTSDLLSVVDVVGPNRPAATDSDGGDGAGAEAGVGGTAAADSGALGGQLDVVAGLIEAGLPARVYSVDLGGFDTHANQAGVHEALLTDLDGALSGFVRRMADRPVTVVVYSEFGRRVEANGSGGTDHGGAGTVLIAGNVRSGFHGEPPPLDRLDDGDLVTTVDFRSVYGGLLEGVLDFDAADLLPGAPPPLALV